MNNIIDKIIKLTKENKIEWNYKYNDEDEQEEYNCYIQNIHIKAITCNYVDTLELELYDINCSVTLEHINIEIKSDEYILYEAIKNNLNFYRANYKNLAYETINNLSKN
jgi:hypothetical protein